MPSPTDVRKTLETLTGIYETVRTENLSLEETTERVSEAIRLYRAFHQSFGQGAFDVKELKLSGDGGVTEAPFAWQTVD